MRFINFSTQALLAAVVLAAWLSPACAEERPAARPVAIVEATTTVAVDSATVRGLSRKDAADVFRRALSDSAGGFPRAACNRFRLGVVDPLPPATPLRTLVPQVIDVSPLASDPDNPEDPPKVTGQTCKVKSCNKKRCPKGSTDCVSESCDYSCEKPIFDGPVPAPGATPLPMPRPNPRPGPQPIQIPTPCFAE